LLVQPEVVCAKLLGDSSVVLQQLLCDRPDRLVAKVRCRGSDFVVKAGLSGGLLAEEVRSNALLAEVGVPVARLVAFESGPPDVVVFGWIDGEPLSAAHPPAVHEHVGRALRAIHAVGGGPPYAGNDTWAKWMRGWLDTVTRVAPPIQVTPEQVDACWAAFESVQSMLRTRGGDLILFDGRPEHILVREGQLAGLIDLGEVRSGDAAMDLAVLAIYEPGIMESVLRGYSPDPPTREAFNALTPLYALLRRLSAVHWNEAHGSPAVAERMRRDLHGLSWLPVLGH
jgi:Ser/Thr protein kinase RdoA (MazF antagonist)